MKIAIYSDNFYPEMSGISDSIILLAKELAKRGDKVNFYVPRYSMKNFLISKLPPVELELGENIEIFRLPSLPCPPTPTEQGRFALPVLSSWHHIKRFDPDIIYTQDFFSAGMEALFVSRLLKKPLVGTNHTPVREFLRYSPFRCWRAEKLILKYVSWYYNHCRWITTPSHGILGEMRAYGFKKGGLFLSNPIQLSDFNPVDQTTKEELKKKFGLSSKTILYTGRLAEEKHIDVIIRAIAIVKKTIPDITMASTGHGNAELSLRKLVKDLSLEKDVFLFGYVEPKALAQLYQASDIFTVMSTAETECISMMQAMATGIPVIGANAWGLPEYITAQSGYVIEPGDCQTLAQKIIYLFDHPGEIERLGQGGVEHVTNFSADRIAAKWQELFRLETT
jgi:1,2-diacylglycerol 3-alpha-glucosyltransferase